MSYIPPPEDLLKEGTLQELILDAVGKYDNFFFTSNSGANERGRLKWLVNEFLICEDERQREFYASVVTSCALRPHAKGDLIKAAGSVLNAAELFGPHHVPSNRKHYAHQVYTFLIGLLLYSHISPLREQLNIEMGNTTNTLSSGTEWGEFLFRWRLSSLSHDIGNAISLFGGETEQIVKHLRFFEAECNAKWFHIPEDASVESIETLNSGKTTFSEFRRISDTNRLYEFAKLLKLRPFKGIQYDHGVVGGIIMARVFDDLYARYDDKKNKIVYINGNRVSFERVFFDQSILRSALAVAEHNIDFYPDEYRVPWDGEILYNIKSNALSFLLKISDLLQEWNKPQAIDETDFLPPEEVSLKLEDDKIHIVNHNKKSKLIQKFDGDIDSNGIVQF